MLTALFRSIVILALCLTGALVPAVADDTRSAMADAMVRMMEAMGLFGSTAGSFSGAPYGGSNPMGMPGWSSAMPGMTGMPGVPGMPTVPGMPGASSVPTPFSGAAPMDPTKQMDQMGQMMERFSSGAPAGGAGAWSAGPLEGIWEGSDDGLLIVQGERYRLYAPLSGYIAGDLRVRGERIELSNQRESFTQQFEYALDQGRLVLRDQNGRIYLYRRLDLNRSTGADIIGGSQRRQ